MPRGRCVGCCRYFTVTSSAITCWCPWGVGARDLPGHLPLLGPIPASWAVRTALGHHILRSSASIEEPVSEHTDPSTALCGKAPGAEAQLVAWAGAPPSGQGWEHGGVPSLARAVAQGAPLLPQTGRTWSNRTGWTCCRSRCWRR